MNRPKLARQRGVAIVTALLLTTLAITIVASLFWQQQVQVRSIENQRLQLQKQWILRGAIDWARLILREDAKFSNVDTLDEPWAVPLVETRLDQFIEKEEQNADASDASLSGQIIDAQSRYNLSNLSVNGSPNPAEVAAFERLLTLLQINPALAQETANLLAQAQRRPAAENVAGEEPRPLSFHFVEDLLAVPGFQPEAVNRLKDFVIFLPRVTKLNVNTAPPEVLSASLGTLSPSDAIGVVNSRRTAVFRDLADFSQRFPGNSTSQLAVSTGYFLINGNVHMDRAGLEIQALVERNGANTRLVWLKEN